MPPNADVGDKAWRRAIGIRSSTALLLLALLGFALRSGGALPALEHFSSTVALVLAVLAPVWSMLAGMLSTVYLVLSVARPYSVLQHLLEMVVAVALTAAMQPPHLG